jgi:hypothetical protein
VPETRTIITVTHPQYWIIDRDLLPEIGPSWYRGFNGLVSVHGSLAIVMTGTAAGYVRLTIDPLGSEPELLTADWDEVVEVSLWFEELGAVTTEGCEGLEDAPPLAASPGNYRVRVHARGRDRGGERGSVWDSPVEEHLVQAWPAPPSAEICHKLTDAYGANFRALQHSQQTS